MPSIDNPQQKKYQLHNQTRRIIEKAYRRGLPLSLIEAIPSLGKSYNSIRAGLETGEPITILTGRGREEQYEQYREWCENARLEHLVLPSFTKDCPCMNGEYSSRWQDRLRELYEKGIPASDIHDQAEDYFGESPPCLPECPYQLKWEFDPSMFDVLIGHYKHAHVPKVVTSRTIDIDEFPEEVYEHTVENPSTMVSEFLQLHDELPFDEYTELIENRDNELRLERSREWFDNQGLALPIDDILEGEALTASTPKVVYTLIFAEDLRNGWGRVTLPTEDDYELSDETFKLTSGHIGLENRKTGEVYLLQPPNFTGANNIVGLDGTPTPIMWEVVLGMRLKPHRVLSDSERTEYLKEILNLEIIQTTRAIKPYHGSLINKEQDAALLEGINHREEKAVDLITSQNALGEYKSRNIIEDYVDNTAYFGNLLGSNDFKESSLGAVIGSSHFGDSFVEKWSAYAGISAERGEEKGTDLTYGTFGDKILTHMREHQTLQALLRFGRDGNGATIYVHTNTLPNWVPIAGKGTVYELWEDIENQEQKNKGLHQVINAGISLGEWRTSELADNVEISERMVRTWLKRLYQGAYIDRSKEGRGYNWRNRSLEDITYGILVVEEAQ